MDRLEGEAPGFTAFVDVDAPEFGLPGHMIDKIYAFCDRTGQKRPDGLGALIRCVNESIALSFKTNIDALEKILGYGLPSLRVVGGGIKNKSLMRMAANALGRPVYAGPSEASAIGNILAQLLAVGEIADVWEGRSMVSETFDTSVYEPNAAESEVWAESYGRYCVIAGLTRNLNMGT
jgi:rhamnulokinase